MKIQKKNGGGGRGVGGRVGGVRVDVNEELKFLGKFKKKKFGGGGGPGVGLGGGGGSGFFFFFFFFFGGGGRVGVVRMDVNEEFKFL